MKIAVLSGKGGTGKTFVSVNLAFAKGKSVYIDCDVEEPNGRLFFKPQKASVEKVNAMVPAVDAQKCTGCRICSEFCKFNALAYIKDKLLIFPELCHACKGCAMLCPEKALSESNRYIGYIEQGRSGETTVITGVLNTGEATGVPVIRRLLSSGPNPDGTVFIDCPPGSGCSVMESIKGADYCLMVAEPTVFGIHNLDMGFNLVKLFKKPHALVVNKATADNSIKPGQPPYESPVRSLALNFPPGDPVDYSSIEKYCMEYEIKIIASIPYDTELGLANSKGLIAAALYPRYMDLFREILETIGKEVRHETAGYSER